MGLAETGAPMVRRCLSVISLMASDTTVSGMMRGPYSSESSSCSRHLGCSAVGSCTIWTMRGLLVPISTSRTLNRNYKQTQCNPQERWLCICRKGTADSNDHRSPPLGLSKAFTLWDEPLGLGLVLVGIMRQPQGQLAVLAGCKQGATAILGEYMAKCCHACGRPCARAVNCLNASMAG